MYVTADVVDAVGRLRGPRARAAIGRAVATSLARDDFRIVVLALTSSPTARIELIVEADDRVSLARGMQGFLVAAARQLNAAFSRRGRVFADRYRARILRTRGALRAAIAGFAKPLLRAAPFVAFTARGSRRTRSPARYSRTGTAPIIAP